MTKFATAETIEVAPEVDANDLGRVKALPLRQDGTIIPVRTDRLKPQFKPA